MKSLLIKDTTEAARANIVAESLGIIDGQCDGCSSGLADMYDDYIYGKRELAEINASFRTNYVKGDDDRDDKGSCMMQKPAGICAMQKSAGICNLCSYDDALNFL